ncbi:MAG: FAD-binding oxidoreductase [Myxococcota bacterium]|nr:FAD-binding oxidoreductase [Myxococcota bacterium]
MSAQTDIVDALSAISTTLIVRADEESLNQYGQDWTRFHTPAPCAIVFPKTIEDVVALVHFARQRALAIVPSGGRTGLSAAAVALNGELVVSFDRMNDIRDFNGIDRTVVCGPGVVTEALQTFATERDLHYPVDFASAGSSQIGGNIATNAGGINVIRYGMTREWVAGLKVVTGTGDVLTLNGGLIKNNTGYDLRHLMIGSEGTLGLIVEATIRLTDAPPRRRVMILGTPDMHAVMEILAVFQRRVDLSAFEFFSEAALSKVIEHAGVRRPFETRCPFYALLEFKCEDDADEALALELFETCLENEWAEDGVMSQSRAQAEALWRCREDISETISRWTPYKNDVSVNVSQVPRFLDDVDNVVAAAYPDLEIVWFGHIGDGNLHLNILKPAAISTEEFKVRCDRVSPKIFDIVQHHGGSISAEHGVGLLKKSYLAYTRSEVEIEIMRGIKRVFDPHCILNPGKIFDVDT